MLKNASLWADVACGETLDCIGLDNCIVGLASDGDAGVSGPDVLLGQEVLEANVLATHLDVEGSLTDFTGFG